MTRRASEVKTVAFVSLGCPKNLVDSERMLGLLAEDGLVITGEQERADVIVINTCGFLEAAKEESLAEIRRAVKWKEEGRCKRVVVAGCLAQRQKTKLLEEVPGIDRLVGVFDREHIVEAVHGRENPRQEHGQFLGKYHDLSRNGTGKRGGRPVFEDDQARLRLTPRHYAYLRISEGCNQGCSFCTIPSIRGPLRSKPIAQILAEAKELGGDGVVELNLIGQDTTSYGVDIGYEPGLGGLLRELDGRLDAGVQWIRLMYAYPNRLTDVMIDTIARCGRVVKYIDLPLQHINDEMLAKMRRRITRKQTEELLAKLRKRIPGVAIRTTLIAGAPGETPAQHEELVRFVRKARFEMMGVFAYSRESGTAMGRMSGQVPEEIKLQRVEELMLAQQEVAFARAREMKGTTMRVLVDRSAEGKDRWAGRAAWQAPEIDSVTLVHGRGLRAGQMIEAKVLGAEGYDVVAEATRA